MTRKKRLLWTFRLMLVPIIAGLILTYAGIELNATPAVVVGVVAFVLGAACLVCVRIISKHPPRKIVKRWKSYLAIKDSEITDYAAELDEVKRNYRADGKKNKNVFDKPVISDVQSFCDFSTLQSGEIYYSCLVRANELLFNPSENTDEALPAMLLYSRDEHYKASPEDLIKISDALYENRENNMLRYETLYHFNEKLDEALTDGREVFLTDVLICRAHVPLGMLGGMRIIPIIADPEKSKSCFVVDCKYWTDKLIHAYITTGGDGEDDGPPDTYGNPFPTENAGDKAENK